MGLRAVGIASRGAIFRMPGDTSGQIVSGHEYGRRESSGGWGWGESVFIERLLFAAAERERNDSGGQDDEDGPANDGRNGGRTRVVVNKKDPAMCATRIPFLLARITRRGKEKYNRGVVMVSYSIPRTRIALALIPGEIRAGARVELANVGLTRAKTRAGVRVICPIVSGEDRERSIHRRDNGAPSGRGSSRDVRARTRATCAVRIIIARVIDSSLASIDHV